MKSGRFTGKKKYILLFILGVMVFLYPTFSNFYYDYIIMKSQNIEAPVSVTASQSPAEETQEASVPANSDTTVSDKEFQQIESDPEMKTLLGKELDYIRAYNKKLSVTDRNTTDPFKENGDGSDKFDTSHNIDTASVFAYIKIDKIHQTLPVYLGATDEHLSKGAAVIQGTSIPIGGESTNSVIAGHTGWVQKFFTDLPELQPGDLITITNRWETLYYKVTGNKLIRPDQEEYLAVISGKDMITLLTCYKGLAKNDRLLVFAERYYPGQKTQEKTNEKRDTNLYSYISEIELKVKPWYEKPQTFVIAAAVILLCLFLYTFISKKK